MWRGGFGGEREFEGQLGKEDADEQGCWWRPSNMLDTGVAASLGKYGHVFFRRMRRGRWERCRFTRSFLSSVPPSLPLTSFPHKPFGWSEKGGLRCASWHQQTLWYSWDYNWAWVGCALMCVCAGCAYEPKPTRTRGVCAVIEFPAYILQSSSAPSQTAGRPFRLWHGYLFATEGLWLTGVASQVFSWPFPSHAWLSLMLGSLWALFRNTGITGRATSPVFFPSELACLPYVWFRKQNPFLCKQPDMWYTFTQRIHTKAWEEKTPVLHLNCFSYVVGMWPHASIFIFRRWFHVSISFCNRCNCNETVLFYIFIRRDGCFFLCMRGERDKWTVVRRKHQG